MTPNELFDTLVYEILIVPVAWTGSDLPMGDTPISTLIKVPFTFIICVFFAAHIIRLVLKPVDALLHKLRRKEHHQDPYWEDWTGMVGMWGGVVLVLVFWAIWQELLNQ